MAEGRWGRLVQDLTEAGFAPRLDEKPYSEIYRGRPRHGVSRSVTIQLPGKGLVTVSDKHWAKNIDVWLGYEVCAEDRDGIIIGRPPRASKNRGETVTAVREALTRLGA